MRKLLLIMAIGLMLPITATAQETWSFRGLIPDVVTGIQPQANLQGHGIAVDGEGKIWFQPFGATENVEVPVLGPQTTRALYIFNPDGSQVSWSPLLYVDLPGGARDTLGGRNYRDTNGNLAWEGMSGRGLRADENGDIIAMQFNQFYRINHKTGAGMNKAVYGPTGTAPAVATDNGLIFSAPVVPGNPIKMYDKDFFELGNAIDLTTGFSRSFEVSPDGNKIYWAGYTTHQITLYERADEFSAFDSVGAVIPGVDSESVAWQPGTGWLWVSAGSPNDAPNRHPNPALATSWLPQTWYAFDPAELAVDTVPTAKAMFTWDGGGDGRPRGLAFSPDGKTAYTTQFNQSAATLQTFTAMPTAIENVEGDIPTSFSLMQNYPNPFNPQTNIQFTVNEAGNVALSVYDLMGREISTLVNRQMAPGTYEVTFDAAGLPSGTYIYRMELAGQSMTGKMTLLK